MVSVRSTLRKKRAGTERLSLDAKALLRTLGLERARLDILLLGRPRMRAMNFRYRNIDKPTDVLSFPVHASMNEFPIDGEFLLGDIVICPDIATAQAKEYGTSAKRRMRELLVHGLAHLVGYDHETGPREEARMRRVEARLLNALEGPKEGA